MSDDLATALAGRPGWRVERDVALYVPPAGVWTARVREVPSPERSYQRWHAAVLRSGTARHTRACATAEEAVRWAQRVADASNATPTTP